MVVTKNIIVIVTTHNPPIARNTLEQMEGNTNNHYYNIKCKKKYEEAVYSVVSCLLFIDNYCSIIIVHMQL